MAKLYPPIGARDLRVTGAIRLLPSGAYEVPANEIEGLLAAGWSRAPDDVEAPQPDEVVEDELAIEDED